MEEDKNGYWGTISSVCDSKKTEIEKGRKKHTWRKKVSLAHPSGLLDSEVNIAKFSCIRPSIGGGEEKGISEDFVVLHKLYK